MLHLVCIVHLYILNINLCAFFVYVSHNTHTWNTTCPIHWLSLDVDVHLKSIVTAVAHAYTLRSLRSLRCIYVHATSVFRWTVVPESVPKICRKVLLLNLFFLIVHNCQFVRKECEKKNELNEFSGFTVYSNWVECLWAICMIYSVYSKWKNL